MDARIANIYTHRLNWAEQVYAAQNRYDGLATASAARAETPAAGGARIGQALRLGAANGYSVGHRLSNSLSSPLINDLSVSSLLGTAAQVVPQLPSSISLPWVGNIAALGGSTGLTTLVGTGASYNPASDTGSLLWIGRALARYGILGFVTELPLIRVAERASNATLANICGALACVTRFVLEVPRVVLMGVAAGLLVGAPSLIGGIVGAALNFAHALVSTKAANQLVASGTSDAGQQVANAASAPPSEPQPYSI